MAPSFVRKGPDGSTGVFHFVGFMNYLIRVINGINYQQSTNFRIKAPTSGEVIDFYEAFGGTQTPFHQMWERLYNHMVNLERFDEGKISAHFLNAIAYFLEKYY